MNKNRQEKLKKDASKEALKYIKPGSIVGIGTGSTVMHFINYLSLKKNMIKGAVSTSLQTTYILKKIGIKVFDLNEIKKRLSVYIDSADEINSRMEMIKGGGAALTKEKIVAANAKKFICILDESKKVDVLGKFPLPIEIIPMACNFIKHEILKIGGYPKIRENIVTDNGNIIIDVHNLKILKPIVLEKKINSIPGIITVGLFAIRSADIAIVGTNLGVKTFINKF